MHADTSISHHLAAHGQEIGITDEMEVELPIKNIISQTVVNETSSQAVSIK